jgi:glucose uptake protein GlcU
VETGYFFALGAFFCIGSYLVPVRFAQAKGLAFLPFMGLGVLAWDLLSLPSLRTLAAHPLWLGASLLSGVLWVCGQIFANLSLEEVSLAKASALFNFNSFINIAFGLLAFREASGLRAYLYLLAGGILLFLGAWRVSSVSAAPSKEGDLRKGVFWGLVTGLFWGLYFVPTKAVQVWGPRTGLGSLDLFNGMALGGTLPLLALFFLRPRGRLSLRNVLAGAVSALLWILGTIGFLSAIGVLGLSRAVPIVNSNGLVYAAWSLWVFKEFDFSQWPKVLGGSLLVAAGVALMAFSR